MYYFRMVAENIGGTQEGEIVSFPTGDYYLAVGDSITWGGGSGFPPILENLLTAGKGYPHLIANEGVSGYDSADGAFWISDTLAGHPSAKYVLILYGTNDAFLPAVSRATYKSNMQDIISSVLSAGKTPYLAKVPYTSDPLRSDSAIQEYNQVIDELVSEYSITVVPPDFYSWFQSNPGELEDGIHPTVSGDQSMANLWFTALTAF